MTNELLKSMIRNIPDFPKKGINFKDITTVLNQPEAFEYIVKSFSKYAKKYRVTAIVAPEARGFIFGAAVAFNSKLKFIPVRKPNKLPGQVFTAHYQLEYGENALQIHQDALTSNDSVLIIDDLIATAGTIHACIELVKYNNAKVACIASLIALTEFKNQHNFENIPYFSLIEL